ncbi:hypothetical protein HYH02_003169 [Chlamydomonas schloesseri]|uniref:Guanylate cyclase domain-containing protein n=1 Tax=Chlamydomonas schloesseri TaxID=2026947 RepID=A0A836B9W7_9CHLO|nr:hypothetical protein HYH02_003169 [Chlamydomonas schloesseri]|eukprot:KAG2452137.1 hypothetical protein HYH02_003169 [Chlamydomonas schloesseri]
MQAQTVKSAKQGDADNDLPNAPYEKQQSLLLSRKASSIKKMYTRWESRGKWWSERDEGASEDGQDSQKSRCSLGQQLQLARDRVVHWFRTLGTVSRKHPTTLVLPLLLLAACLAGGIVGVELAANKAAQQAQDAATAAAEQTAASLHMLLGGQALQAAASLAAQVEQRPSALAALAAAVQSAGVAGAAGGTGARAAGTALLLAPFGFVQAPPASGAAGAAANGTSGGADLLQSPLRGGVLAAVRSQVPTLALLTSDPRTPLLQRSAAALRLLALQPVFVAGVERSEDWGNLRGLAAAASGAATANSASAAPPLADLNSAECAGTCYEDSTRSKLWGFTGAAVPLAAALAAPDSGLADLSALGYRYRLTMRLSPATLVTSTSTPTAATSSNSAAAASLVAGITTASAAAGAGGAASGQQQQLDEVMVVAAVSSSVPSGKQVTVPLRLGARTQTAGQQDQHQQQQQQQQVEGELQVASDTGSWRPDWEGPLIAVVVCVSVALAWLLLVALLAYRRHRMLLQAMLPEDVLALLAAGQRYYQHLDNVTVLYADVVRYMANGPNDKKSDSKSGGADDGAEDGDAGGANQSNQTSAEGLPTRDVVKLLNAVNSMYDGIMAKYGLVKIQRSGESFLAVGGCTPPPGASRGGRAPQPSGKGAAAAAVPSAAAGGHAATGAAATITVSSAGAAGATGATAPAGAAARTGGEEDPVAVAVRVASAARDMVLATARFRGSGGFRVQLRVGLHSGPAVAAVVGTKLPRFSLFGDVVDVAYYMEATGSAMAVHVSQTTMQLLTLAGNPLLQLQPRGPLDMGAAPGEMGAMSTAWLRLEALPDPTIEAEAEARARAAAGLPYTSYSAAAAAGRRGGTTTATAGGAGGGVRTSNTGSDRSSGVGRSWRPRLSLHLTTSSAMPAGAAAAGASPSKPLKTPPPPGGKRGARGGSGGGADGTQTSPLPTGKSSGGGAVATSPTTAARPPPLLPGDSDVSIGTLPSQQVGAASGYDEMPGGYSDLGGLATVEEGGMDFATGEGARPRPQQHRASAPSMELPEAPSLATTVSGYGGCTDVRGSLEK